MRFLPALLFLVLAAGVRPVAGDGESEPRSATGPPAAAEPEVTETTLAEIRRAPSSWVGREVAFTVQFEDRLDDWNPWTTRFGHEDFVAFGGWADEEFLWRREVWEDPARHLFARRGTRAAAALGRGRRYDRIRVRGFVRTIFLDEPWIEITRAERLPGSVGEGTIVHAARGIERMTEGAWVLAQGELERAQLGGIPEHARAELDRLRVLCSERAADD